MPCFLRIARRRLGLFAAVLATSAVAGEHLRLPLQEVVEHSARPGWEQKPVLARRMLDDAENPATWTHQDFGTMTFSTERARDGRQSVRLHSKTKGDQPTKDNRPWGYCSAVRVVDGEDWSQWNRLALWIYPDLPGHNTVSIYIVVNNDGGKKRSRDNIILRNHEWNHIVSEFEFLPRHRITSVEIKSRLSGNEPGTSDTFTYFIDRLELQRVAPDHYQGWDCAPGKIAFSHSGYAIGSPKSAVASDLTAVEFKVVDAATQQAVLTKTITTATTPRGRFQILEFSELDRPGSYFLQAGQTRTRSFQVSDQVWLRPLEKALNFFYVLRCGFAVPGVHGPSHQDWRATNGEKSVRLTGGWYDAGDLSQGLDRTAEAAATMFQLAERLQHRSENPALAQQLMAEATWGLDWVLQTTLHDGLRPMWAVQGWWSNGIVGDNDDPRATFGRSTRGFMAAAGAEAIAYRLLKDADPARAAAGLKTAEEDWGFGINTLASDLARDATCQAASETVLASLELLQATGAQKYADQALALAPQLVAAQERTFVPGSKPGLCGFLYTNPKRERILHSVFGSGAHEHTQLVALARLCDAFPDHPQWMEWYSAVAMYGDLHQQIAASTAPYGMLPAGVYRDDEPTPGNWAGESLRQQLLAGQRIGDHHVVRALPANDGHFGQLHLQLTQARGLAVGARLRGDLAAAQLAERQLEWTLGRNPLCRSFMYGEGYDYLPLYSPMCGNIVGALPVGLPSFGAKDEPYWKAGSNEPSPKEQWVQTVTRFLGLIGEVSGPAELSGRSLAPVRVRHEQTGVVTSTTPDTAGNFRTALPPGRHVATIDGVEHHVIALPGGNYRIDPQLAFTVASSTAAAGQISIEVVAHGTGSHTFALRTSNVTFAEPAKTAALLSSRPQRLTWTGTVIAPTSPWYVVVVPDGDLTRRQEASLPASRR
jgi:hypothetical protein